MASWIFTLYTPFLGSGEMITDALDLTAYADLPHKFEAGTPAIAETMH